MSTPEQPDAPALTRKQMREIRNTGSTPIVSGDAPSTETPVDEASPATDAAPEIIDAAPAITPAPLPRAAIPPAVGDAPIADASVDLGVTPLTRRQARQQERIRTASVPVITPDVAAAHAAASAAPASDIIDAVPEGENPTKVETLVEVETFDAEVADAATADDDGAGAADVEQDLRSEEDRAIVSPQLGADLLAGEPIEVALPPSFDQLISRSVTGAITTGNALILSQTPSAPPLSAPVTATGEVLITGSFDLPEGLGSTGHAAGTADGKDVDAVLVDGELPAHSSPTPIAASAAISTAKTAGDVITPPTPEKGGRLMMTLAITAGVLALALVGVLILAFVTGVF
ncbi:MAG: hypothetical protein ABWY37_02845 [Microbacterium pygmaeum]